MDVVFPLPPSLTPLLSIRSRFEHDAGLARQDSPTISRTNPSASNTGISTGLTYDWVGEAPEGLYGLKKPLPASTGPALVPKPSMFTFPQTLSLVLECTFALSSFRSSPFA